MKRCGADARRRLAMGLPRNPMSFFSRARVGDAGQSTVEYAVALSVATAIFIALGVFWRFSSGEGLSQGIVESLMSRIPGGLVYAAML